MSQECYTSSITATTPDSDFTVNGDGTVTHINTGLMWKVCSEGQTWANGDCTTGTITTHTWQEALQIPQTLNNAGGYSNNIDWRLPNIKELLSIIEVQCYEPAINETIFPSTSIYDYWSSSPTPEDSSYAWVVYFGYGYLSWGERYDPRGYGEYVRLVRDGQ